MLLNDVDIVDERIVGRMGEYTRSQFLEVIDDIYREMEPPRERV